MRVRWRSEADGWSAGGDKITAPETLALIRQTMEDEGPVLVAHSFYRGGSGPEYLTFSDFDEFIAYLDGHAYAGDFIEVWSVWRVCKAESRLASGKCPDDEGMVPRGGAY